jgi:hypothetical protein
LRYFLGICLEGLRKTTKIPVGVTVVTAEIRTEHFQNISLKLDRYTRLLNGYFILVSVAPI